MSKRCFCKILITTLFFLCCHFRGDAQKLIFKNYTIQDGLIGNYIRCIYQDNDGFMWIGTGEGLSKYDGNKFTNYSTATGLGFNYINAIHETNPNQLLIAENNGTTDIAQHGEIIRDKRVNDVIVNKIIRGPEDNIVGITDYNGLCIFSDGKLKTIYKDIAGTEIARFADSFYVSGGEGLPLTFLHAGSFEFATQIIPAQYFFNTLYTDRHNNTWVGTKLFGLKLIETDRTGKYFRIIDPPKMFSSSAFKNTSISAILQEERGGYWIGTEAGLVKINVNGKQQIFTVKDGLPSNIIQCIFQDREKNIWVGTKEGLSKIVTLNNVQIFEIGQESGSYDWQQLWKYSDEELFAFTGSVFKKINTATQEIQDWSKPVITQNGAFYPGKFNVLKYQPAKSNSHFTNIDIGLSVFEHTLYNNHALFACAAKDKAGNLYYGTYNGVLVYTNEYKLVDTLVRTRIATLDFDNKGNLWAGTWNKGIYRITLKNDTRITEDMSSVLPDKSVRSTFEDSKGNFWIGLRNDGLVMVKNYDTSGKNVFYFNKQTGLSSGWVRCITEDANKNIWVGTNQGLNKLIPFNNGYRVFDFGKVDNLSPAIYGIVSLPGGVLWSLSSIGLIRLEDSHIDTASLYNTSITSVITAGSGSALSWQQLQKRLSLEFQKNSIQFEFSVPTFINERQVNYSYRLLGSNDSVWSKPSATHSVSYASLQHGNYEFQVRALGWNGQWGTASVYSFSVLPPFWKTWWFLTLASFAIIIIIYTFYRYRLSQALKLQSVRNRIAADLHDEIGSTLTNVSILSELSRQSIQKENDANKFLGRIAEEVNTSGQALDDIIWSVNVRNDSFEELIFRMRRYAGELFDEPGTQYNLEFDEDLADTKLNMELRRDIYLVFKETLNNIHKHALASSVKVNLSKEYKKIVLHVADNGKGFDKKETHRNGLRNIQSRAAKWNGVVKINSAIGKGTIITVFFSCKKINHSKRG